MCGRYVDPNEAAVEAIWRIDRRDWRFFDPPRYNVAPTMPVAVILRAPDGALELQGARWGLIPHWWSKDKLPTLTFNARSEEAASKPMWRESLRSRRCIMPARGWYEWNEHQAALNPSGKPTHQPYYFHAPDEAVLSIAGIWSVWQRGDAPPIMSCALLTKEAGPDLAAIHHRMPVVLSQDEAMAWLDAEHEAGPLIAGAQQVIRAYPIGTAVNSVKNDFPGLLEPLKLMPEQQTLIP